jgi:hypothetical protein
MDRECEVIELDDAAILTMSLELRKAVDMCAEDLKFETLNTLIRDSEQITKKARQSYVFKDK